MTRHSDKVALIHGLADGELDAANAIAIEAHLRECRDCQEELERIQALRDLLGTGSLKETAPERLHAKIETMLDNEVRRPPASSELPARHSPRVSGRVATAGRDLTSHVLNGRWASGALTGLVAASLVLALAMPQLAYTGTENELVQSHIRSLQVGHLVDIPTSDRHVVKPWFNGKVDFAPPVPELAQEGFPLVGGRLDYIDNHEVAAIVYRHRQHVINLFVRPAHGLSLPNGFVTHYEGYNLVRWTGGGLEYWAVSDVDENALEQFQQAYRARTRS